MAMAKNITKMPIQSTTNTVEQMQKKKHSANRNTKIKKPYNM